MAVIEHLSDEQIRLYCGLDSPAIEIETVHPHLDKCDSCRGRMAEIIGELGTKPPDHGVVGTGTVQQFETDRVGKKSDTAEVKSSWIDVLSALGTIPGYTNIRELMDGGMGAVYLAQNTNFQREEVLKVVIPSLRYDAQAMSRFKQEIEVIGRLNHPNIVTPYATYVVGDLLVLSMEYAGENLEQFVKRQELLTVVDACRFIVQVAEGLQHAHEKQVVHRDIKPNNIMMTRLGNKPVLKIVDFGLAKARVEDFQTRVLDNGLTPNGTAMGTPAYMSPEQWQDSKNVDIRADIYALGCTLYFLLTKKPPFQKDSFTGYLTAHAQEQPPPLNDLRADIPADLTMVAAKMLAKDPGQRYQTPADVARALAPFTQSGTTIDWKPAVKHQAVKGRMRGVIAVGLAVLILGLLALGASTLLVKTRDGTIELTNLTDGAEVLVDGDIVNLNWAAGKQSAEIRVKPGTRKLEVKRNGVTIVGESVNIVQDGRTVVDGKLKAGDVVANPKAALVDSKPPPVIADAKPKPVPGDAKPSPVAVVPKPGPPPVPPDFVPLFNGKDLAGWEQVGSEAAIWKVVNKVLVGTFPDGVGGSSMLKTTRSDFQNFHLRLVTMKSEGWGSRINLFSPLNGPRQGAARYRVSLGSPQNAVNDEFGRLTFMEKGENTILPLANPVKVEEKKWMTLDIIYQRGKRVIVEVNGVKTANVIDLLKESNHKTDIRIYLGASLARFKSIEIKELP